MSELTDKGGVVPTATRVPAGRRVRIRPGYQPEDWYWKESLTFLHPQGTANVIASSEPLAAGIDSQQYAEVQGDLLRKEFPQYGELAFEPIRVFGGLPGFLRVFEWTPPDGVRVAQAQLYAARDGRGYTATATTPAEHYPEHEQTMLAILQALELVPEPDGP